MATHRTYARWQRRYGSPETAEKSEAFIEWLEAQLKTTTPPFPLTGWQADPLAEFEAMGDDYSKGLWDGRMLQLMQEEAISAPAERPEDTIRAHIKDYLKQRETDCEQGRIKLGTYQVLACRINVFNRWVAPDAPLESINELLLQDYFNYLAKQVECEAMGDNHASACMAEARAFIRSRSDLRYLELPRNINSRKLTISVLPKAIETLTTAEVKQLLETPKRLKLYVLLMLNCGMTSSDIGQLTKDEVDWKHGRIIRVRSKTRGKSEKVPTVNYRLWPETFKLLTQYKSNDPNLALTITDGGPLWKMHRTESGKISKVDNIASIYSEWCVRNGIPRKQLKRLRKTAASMLADHPKYARYAQHFLGHAPSSVADRHYVTPSQPQFDLALTWLGKQFGIIN
jgi:integrase